MAKSPAIRPRLFDSFGRSKTTRGLFNDGRDDGWNSFPGYFEAPFFGRLHAVCVVGFLTKAEILPVPGIAEAFEVPELLPFVFAHRLSHDAGIVFEAFAFDRRSPKKECFHGSEGLAGQGRRLVVPVEGMGAAPATLEQCDALDIGLFLGYEVFHGLVSLDQGHGLLLDFYMDRG